MYWVYGTRPPLSFFWLHPGPEVPPFTSLRAALYDRRGQDLRRLFSDQRRTKSTT